MYGIILIVLFVLGVIMNVRNMLEVEVFRIKVYKSLCVHPKYISTSNFVEKNRLEPLHYSSNYLLAKNKVLSALRKFNTGVIVKNEGKYIKAEFKSCFFGFIEDVDIYFDDEAKEIHYFSKPRTKYYISTQNKKRFYKLKKNFYLSEI